MIFNPRDSKIHLNRYGIIVFTKKFTKYLSDLYCWGNDDSSIKGKLKSDFEVNFATKNQIHQINDSDFISMSMNGNEDSVSSTKQMHINRDLELLKQNNLEPNKELRQIRQKNSNRLISAMLNINAIKTSLICLLNWSKKMWAFY